MRPFPPALTGVIVLGAAAGLAAAPATAAPNPIEPAEMSATVKVLASDAFQGRAPGTPGEAKTVAYLITRFKALGLKPGGPGLRHGCRRGRPPGRGGRDLRVSVRRSRRRPRAGSRR